jgi:hypothetical protein
MLGDGFLKQMADTLKYNRELLGKKKSARELYKEEAKSRGSTYQNVDLHALRERVANRLKRNRFYEFINRTVANLLLIAFFYGIYWLIVSKDLFLIRERKEIHGSDYFKTTIYHQSDRIDLKVDYYPRGPKASETFFKDGLRHNNSESYYSTGEQFRSALYYRDTLITELYLFKSGDTIKKFPQIVDDKIHHIKLIHSRMKKRVEFDFFDGKIIPDTYKEYYIINK